MNSLWLIRRQGDIGIQDQDAGWGGLLFGIVDMEACGTGAQNRWTGESWCANDTYAPSLRYSSPRCPKPPDAAAGGNFEIMRLTGEQFDKTPAVKLQYNAMSMNRCHRRHRQVTDWRRTP